MKLLKLIEKLIEESMVWSSYHQKMMPYKDFPVTHIATKDVISSLSGRAYVHAGDRLSSLGNDNYLNLETGEQPIKLEPDAGQGRGLHHALKKAPKTQHPEYKDKSSSLLLCPKCGSADIKTYSNQEKECHDCHKTWDLQPENK